MFLSSTYQRIARVAGMGDVHCHPMVQMAIFKLLLGQLIIQFIVAADRTQAQRLIPNSKFEDPIVWNSNSLYRTTSLQANLLDNSQDKRIKRSATEQTIPPQLVDACQSEMKIITPYYGVNSKSELRTIVNSELMQQAIQVETCIRSPRSSVQSKCSSQNDCGCEQKYKWHRLLVLDPKDSGVSKGLFMDWFLFPSNCVCRCKGQPGTTKNFLKAIKKN